MRLFTLAAKRCCQSSCLNGKIFTIREINDGKTVEFIEVITNSILWEITDIIDYIDTGNIRIYKTWDSVYTLLNISSIIPTQKEIDFNVECIICDTKSSNCSNSYDTQEFIFNREITDGDFINYLIKNNYKINNPKSWNDDYSLISGSGFKWTYKWVRVYNN